MILHRVRHHLIRYEGILIGKMLIILRCDSTIQLDFNRYTRISCIKSSNIRKDNDCTYSKGKLAIAKELYDFIENEALPGSGLDSETYWKTLNKSLLILALKQSTFG